MLRVQPAETIKNT